MGSFLQFGKKKLEKLFHNPFIISAGKGIFFLNEYFEIGIKKNIIGYVRLFSPDKNANDKIRILDIAENN